VLTGSHLIVLPRIRRMRFHSRSPAPTPRARNWAWTARSRHRDDIGDLLSFAGLTNDPGSISVTIVWRTRTQSRKPVRLAGSKEAGHTLRRRGALLAAGLSVAFPTYRCRLCSSVPHLLVLSADKVSFAASGTDPRVQGAGLGQSGPGRPGVMSSDLSALPGLTNDPGTISVTIGTGAQAVTEDRGCQRIQR